MEGVAVGGARGIVKGGSHPYIPNIARYGCVALQSQPSSPSPSNSNQQMHTPRTEPVSQPPAHSPSPLPVTHDSVLALPSGELDLRTATAESPTVYPHELAVSRPPWTLPENHLQWIGGGANISGDCKLHVHPTNDSCAQARGSSRFCRMYPCRMYRPAGLWARSSQPLT